MENGKSGTFKFGTKAETLEKIRPLLKLSHVPSQIFFNLAEFENNEEELIKKIQSSFDSEFVVVRSSALNEDSKNSSMAGIYESVLNVNKFDREELLNAIEKVKNSYLKDHKNNPQDQILIQSQIINPKLSGVIFTRCANTGAPYYILNYDDLSGKTDSVTSGKSSTLKSFSYFKHLNKLPNNPLLSNLIQAARELEIVIGIDALDIEFAISNNGAIYLLQVRPLISEILKEREVSFDTKVKKTIDRIKEFINANEKSFPNLHGYKSIFGMMPDWNPAEIIGESPKPLAFSLYRELITDCIWPQSRKELGYKDVGYHPGVVSLGGKPYVDVRLSFNTFVPQGISETTSEKLVNFYIDKLINNPEMHDKIEFKIAYTCYKLGFENEEQELKQNNFSNLQIKEIKENLIILTNDIVTEKYTTIDSQLDLCRIMGEKREKVISSEIDETVKISQLIHDCEHYGTLPFSKLARFAFIGNIIIDSMVDAELISRTERENFFKSINSVAIEFLNKISMLKKNLIKKEDFIREFGHLRPGTYDICSGTYEECFNEYFNLQEICDDFKERSIFEFDKEKKRRIDDAFKNEGFLFTAEQFFSFARRAFAAREKSKFEFTKNLSKILDYCYAYLKKFSFSKEDLSFLEINDIITFSHKTKSINELELLKEKIQSNREMYKITKALRLPPLIYTERNAEYFHYFDNKPNFITDKIVVGELVNLHNIKDISELKGKIVLIPNADPGYDWIFSHNILGLLTKYGGVASHMSIRCAEMGIPSAIGCGATIFDNISNFKKIELNCLTNQMRGIF